MRETARRLPFIVALVALMMLMFIGDTPIQAQEKKYIAGIEAAFPPWAYIEAGKAKGFAVDAVREIAKLEGFKVEFKDLPWPSLVPALAAGKIDMLVTGLTVTRERDKRIDFTIPWWELNQEVVVKKDSDLNIVTALSGGVVIGTQAGSTAFDWVKEQLIDKGVKVKQTGYEEYVTAIEDLIIGRVSSVICYTSVSREFIEAGRPVKTVGRIYTREPQALAVTQGDPHKLLPKLNRGIVKIFESGKWAEIVHNYWAKAVIQPVPTWMPEYIEGYRPPIPGLE